MRHPVAAQLDRIANAALGLRQDPERQAFAHRVRVGSDGGLASGCIQIVPGGIEGPDKDRRGLRIERGHRNHASSRTTGKIFFLSTSFPAYVG